MTTTTISIAIVLFGALVFVLGLLRSLQETRERRSWRRETATVTGFVWGGAHSNRRRHWIMERRDAAGHLHTRRSSIGTSGGFFEKYPFDITVLVDPHDESTFVPASGIRSLSGYWIFVVIGLIFSVVGFLMYWIGAAPPTFR